MQTSQPEDRRAKESRSRKVFVGFAALASAATLAAIAGNRLSGEARAVLAGAVCGVGAAIPTGLALSRVIGNVVHRRAIAGKDRAAWCEAQAELSERRARRFEALALRLPAHRHQFVVHACLDRQIADALRDGDLDRVLELSRAAPRLPEGVIAAPADIAFAPASTWPGGAP